VGDSDVGKQEIISGMEDGSLDSPYCSSTGAGTLQGPWTYPTVVQHEQVPYKVPGLTLLQFNRSRYLTRSLDSPYCS
jgi:hypothetical protein